ncbi:MAG: hypothetical protein KIS77_01070 [Saprospiraceae bacterium]|nr:hypothetical protein [Saprospiraceae bacterium]
MVEGFVRAISFSWGRLGVRDSDPKFLAKVANICPKLSFPNNAAKVGVLKLPGCRYFFKKIKRDEKVVLPFALV